MPHVIWDWNGTLFDDLDIVVAAVNVSLERFDAGPITDHDYREHYTRPVKLFYERLLDREVAEEEWRWIDEHFHLAYRESTGRAGLTAGACDALAAVARAGATQSILSMWWHEELVPMVGRLGIAPYMARVDGNRSGAGDRKAEHLAAHVTALQGGAQGSDGFVMIGDSLDDGRAAADNGIDCVMFDSGSHHRHELESTGYPVADSLVEAIALCGIR